MAERQCCNDWRALIPYSTQSISLLDRWRVFRALDSQLITQGPKVAEFEAEICKMVGASYGVAVNSATSALHIACLSLGLGPGDIMWTSPVSFVASANCAKYCGAQVDFVDIDPESWNISIERLREKLDDAERRRALPKLLVVVHFAGEPADLEQIHDLSLRFGFKVIEDASHALGSKYKGQFVGSSTYSEITVFSFHAVKNITTGEGGMAVTNDSRLASTLRLLRSHGITREASRFVAPLSEQTPWHYEQHYLGYNYRLTDFQAVLGMSQLKKLMKQNGSRAQVAARYRDTLARFDNLKFQFLSENSISAFHLVVVRVPPELRTSLSRELASRGLASNLHYPPIHLHPFYGGERREDLAEAEKFGLDAITLPCHSLVGTREFILTVEAFEACFEKNRPDEWTESGSRG